MDVTIMQKTTNQLMLKVLQKISQEQTGHTIIFLGWKNISLTFPSTKINTF